MGCKYGPQGFHLRDTDGVCLECDSEEASYAGGHTELLLNEPPPASVVLTQGPTGTAWQRFYSDGLWHAATGRHSTWEVLMSQDRPGSRIRLVYVPAGE